MYKGRGRIQRAMMTRAYEAFRVHDEKLQASIPTTPRARGCRVRSDLASPLCAAL